MMRRGEVKDLSGKQFNHWEVLQLSYIDKKSHNAYFACRCDICGRVYDVRSDSLQEGTSTKCVNCARNRKRCGDYADII